MSAQRTAMLRIRLAASGEEVVALDAAEFQAVVDEPTVQALKRYLALKHFCKKFSCFQLRLLREGDSSQMRDEEAITPPLELQLVLMNFEFLPPDEERDQLFWEICEGEETDEVERRLEGLQNPNVVAHGCTALALVAGQSGLDGQAEHIARLLLEAGADTEGRDFFGFTSLHVAASNDVRELARMLLMFAADIEAVHDHGVRPLHLACGHSCTDMVQFLLDSGANKEAEDSAGKRPLHWAAGSDGDFGEPLEVVQLLVKAGVEKDARDQNGTTAAQVATGKGYADMAHLLEDKRRRLP